MKKKEEWRAVMIVLVWCLYGWWFRLLRREIKREEKLRSERKCKEFYFRYVLFNVLMLYLGRDFNRWLVLCVLVIVCFFDLCFFFVLYLYFCFINFSLSCGYFTFVFVLGLLDIVWLIFLFYLSFYL